MDTQKQQVAERVKQANNILVTVSTNPSVDQLAACLGLTLSLNKMGKHATAVFSGGVPSTIEFLQPEKTLEKNTDSLRDFIIALDKSKADKLRYKVEDRVVKIFITPYKTSISNKDLEFSQGDFNVDVVLALGVHAQTDLDQAITAHGRILHDATVVTLNVRPGGELGALNWLNPTASSLSELAVQLVDALDKKLMDGQIATAFLTGIVAETERFSNAKTSPQTMSISAELMSLGANQQLVATKLEEPVTLPPAPVGPIAQQDAHTGQAKDVPPEPSKKPDDGTLEIAHEDDGTQGEQGEPQSTDTPGQPQGDESNIPSPSEQPNIAEGSAVEPEHPKIHDVKTVGEDATAHEAKKEKPQQPEPFNASTLLPEPQNTSEAELPAPEVYEPTPPPQINIDEHGAISPLQSQEDAEEAAASALLPPRSQEPPTISHHSEAPKMVLEPPTLGGQLTANATPDSFGASGDDEDRAAGLPGVPTHDMPMLGSTPGASQASGTPSLASDGTPTPVAPTILGATPDEPQPANAPGTAFLGDQPLEDPAANTSPLTPAAGETLSDIERDVHSSHLDSQPQMQVPVVGPDDLTPEEVARAFGGVENVPSPESASTAPASPPLPPTSTNEDQNSIDSARDAVMQAISQGSEAAGVNPQAFGAPSTPSPAAPPVQPWTPPADTSPSDAGAPPATAPPIPNPATQFDPAAFGQPPLPEEQNASFTQPQPQNTGAPPATPPPMMPPA